MLTPGTRLGVYEISALAGKGGMGEVYVARDSKLGRVVAIKVLPEGLASDPTRLARFEREARVLATLNHPHIAQIYELEHASGIPALVMELVDGPTLADHLALNTLPLREALRIARQIAEALEAAHERGIVHRDLKPSNIKLTAHGEVKVLDFGLATIREEDSARLAELITEDVSSPNAIVGTPAYMAPEQAKGESATHAADVWAFGCVLFALISGKPPFGGTTTTEILAEVLKSEPDWSRLPADTPPMIRRTLRHCLAKDVRARFHHIADVRLALEDADETPAPVPAYRSSWRERAVWIVATVGLGAGAIFFAQRPIFPAGPFDIVTPPEADAGGIALSSDGTNLAYTALAKGVPYLYVRSLENGAVRALEGTQGAALPFWSPAGDALGFFAESRLKLISLDTGAIRELAPATLSPAGGSWNRDGTIVFAPNIRGRILRVPAAGGEVVQVLPQGRSPRFLADGRRFLFLPLNGVSVGSLDSSKTTLLSDTLAFALPGPPGYLTFVKGKAPGQLLVQAFDEDALTLSGAERVIAERVQTSSDGVSLSATVSQTGVIALREPSTADAQPRRLSEFDRAGTEIRKVGDLAGLSPAISPAFDYVAVNRNTSGGIAVYLLELARGTLNPFTSGPVDQTAIFSSDGRSIVFSTMRRGRVEMFIKPVEGGEERPLLDPPPDMNARVATDWVGDFLLFRENAANTSNDVYALPMRGTDRRPIPIAHTGATERDAQFSPDTKWVAYESDKSGRSEIYLTRFPMHGRQFQISPGGGAQVRWNPANRNELFYVALDGRLMSIPLEFTSDDAAVTASDPVTLFQTRFGTVVQGAQRQQYVVSKDGRRFFVSNAIEDALSPITLILDWKRLKH